MNELLKAELRRRMKAAKLTQKKLSLLAGLGETAVSDILNDKSKNPTARVLTAIAAQLGCKLSDLTEGAQSSDGHAAIPPDGEISWQKIDRKMALQRYLDYRQKSDPTFSLNDWATRANVSKTELQEFLEPRNKIQSITADTYDKLAEADGVSILVLLGEVTLLNQTTTSKRGLEPKAQDVNETAAHRLCQLVSARVYDAYPSGEIKSAAIEDYSMFLLLEAVNLLRQGKSEPEVLHTLIQRSRQKAS